MEWLINLFVSPDSVAHIALLYAMVIAIGVYLGKIKFGGIALGVTFVLFAGILAGHFGLTAPTNFYSGFWSYPVCLHDWTSGGTRFL